MAGAGREAQLRRLPRGRSGSWTSYSYVFYLSLIVGVICFLIRPFNLPSNLDAAVGLLIGCRHRCLRVAAARHEPEAPDRRRHRQRARHHRRLSLRARHPQQHPCQPDPELPADHGHADHGLCGIGGRRQQRRPAQSGSARRNLRRRKTGQEELQDPRHQRHHRRPHRRHRRDRIPRRPHCHPAVRASRTATRRRLRRFAQTQSRTPRPGHPAASAENRLGLRFRLSKTTSPASAKST